MLRNGNTSGQRSVRGTVPLLMANAVFQRNSETLKHKILYTTRSSLIFCGLFNDTANSSD